MTKTEMGLIDLKKLRDRWSGWNGKHVSLGAIDHSDMLAQAMAMLTKRTA